MNPEINVKIGAKLSIQSLTDEELSQLAHAIRLGLDPRAFSGYDKVSHLFTLGSGTRAHDLVKEAFRESYLSRVTL